MGIIQDAFSGAYEHAPPDLIPELMLLGTLSKEEQFHDNGICIEMDVITYEGKQYIMKMEKAYRWYDKQ